jgi:type II secretory pathway pseudopilin PulG
MTPHSLTKKTNILKKNDGNALVLILILIALLAALTTVAMRSSSRSSSNMDVETARIQSEKLMRQAKSFESGIGQLMSANQCSSNDVNFVNATTTRVYTNANSPVSKICDLFSLEGAGQTYSNPNSVILDASQSARSDYGQWVFTGSHCVLGIGSDDNNACVDSEIALIAIVPHVNLSTCLQINNMNGIENPSGAPPTESYDDTAPEFTGTYTAIGDPELGETASGLPLVGQTTGCFKNTSGAWSNSYIFYHVLNAR